MVLDPPLDHGTRSCQFKSTETGSWSDKHIKTNAYIRSKGKSEHSPEDDTPKRFSIYLSIFPLELLQPFSGKILLLFLFKLSTYLNKFDLCNYAWECKTLKKKCRQKKSVGRNLGWRKHMKEKLFLSILSREKTTLCPHNAYTYKKT